MGGPSETLERILADAVEIAAAADRQAFVERACGGDAALRARVEELVAHHFNAGGFLEPPQAALATVAWAGEAGSQQVGPYTLREPLGEGGMGLVYVAEQHRPVRRLVALKVIKPGMDSKQVVARFEAERQALALMDHPNIAKVLDAGTTADGRPFFVMELIRGLPITAYCDQARLTVRQRLELFAKVCRAVQHAHTKGVIHRDLKPGNVLVTSHDGAPAPVVIDFGVAKALAGPLTDRTVYTGFHAMVGTPLYMSPEQVEFNQLGVDARSDVYALGVVLYELLTGATPIDRERLKAAGYDEFRRILREEEPPRPSARSSTAAEAATTASARRCADAGALTRTLRGELDWIVLKALEKDRNRRYQSAGDFAADVDRYLNNEAVAAHPPSRWYRLRKLARRNRPGVAAASVIVAAVLVAAGGYGWVAAGGYGWVARDRAEREAAVAGRVHEALDESDRAQEAGRLSEALAAARRAETLGAGLTDDPALVRRTRDRVLDLDTVIKLDENFVEDYAFLDGKHNRAARLAEFSRLFRAIGVDPAADAPDAVAVGIRERSAPVEMAAALDEWVQSLGFAGRAAGDPLRSTLSKAAQLADPDPWRNRIRQAREAGNQAELEELGRTANVDELPAATLRLLGQTLYLRYALDAPAAPARDFLRRAHRRRPDELWLNFLLAAALCWHPPYAYEEGAGYLRVLLSMRPNSPRVYQMLGLVMDRNGKPDDAQTYYREAVRLRPDYADALVPYAYYLNNKGRLDEAIAYCRAGIARDPTSALLHNQLGLALNAKFLYPDAIASFRKAVELDPKNTWLQGNLADALMEIGAFDEGVTVCRAAIELDPAHPYPHNVLAKSFGLRQDWKEMERMARRAIDLDPNFAKAYGNLSVARQMQGSVDEGVALARKAIDLDPTFSAYQNILGVAFRLKKQFEPAIAAFKKAIELDPRYYLAHSSLGLTFFDLGRYDDALASCRRAVEIAPHDATPHCNLGLVLRYQGRIDEAIAECRKAIELKPGSSESYDNLGCALLEKGQVQEAVEALRKAVDLNPVSTTAHNNLANALAHAGKLDEAIAEARKGLDLEPQSATSRANLAGFLQDLGKSEEAFAEYRRAIKLSPGPGESRVYSNFALALVHCENERLRDYDEALRLGRKAKEVNETDYFAWVAIGAAHYRRGELKDAIVPLTKAIELSPNVYTAPFYLAMIHWRLGDKTEAIKQFKAGAERLETLEKKTPVLLAIRAEAAAMLGITLTDPKPPQK